ncbi:MAG: ABC transporter permease [Anaerolineae bacterium]
MTSRRPDPTGALLAGIPLTFLGLFFLYPVASVLAKGLADAGELRLDALSRVVLDPRLRGVAWFTVWQATLSTLLTMAAALPGSYLVARYDFPGKRFVRAAATVPFVLPTVVVASAFLSLLGPRSPLNPLIQGWFDLADPPLRLQHTIWAILIAHIFYNYAVVLRTVGGAWSQLDPAVEEAARVLGASRWQAFREVTLPLLRPAVVAAASIVFLFTFTSFGVVLLLGGPRFATLEVEIYRQTAQLLNLPVASALAMVQMAGVFLLLVAYSRYEEHRAVIWRMRPARQVSRRPRSIAEWATVGAILAGMALLLAAPLLVLVERSLAGAEGYGLSFYQALSESRRGSTLFVPPIEAIRNSLAFAAGATGIALAVGTMASVVVARRRGWASRLFDAVLMLPLGTSAVTVGLGFLIALDRPPLNLRASPLLIPIAHALVAIPFVVRAVAPVVRSIDQRLREAASMLGAAPRRVWREVDLPLVSRSLLVAAGFAFAVSLGEFGATVFIARPDFPTLPIAIFRFLGQPGGLNFGQAMAMSSILMAITAMAILVIERFRIGEVGGF